jgi:uracil-DNA glycosylase family 4
MLGTQSCARCSALVASRRQIVHGYGDSASRVVFVGEAPGRHGADRTGVPFSGDKSGRTLQRIWIELGLSDERAPADAPHLRCFVTNVVRCCPPGNRPPTPAEQSNCAPFLTYELDQLDPRIVVPVGLIALRAVGMRYLGYAPAAIRPLHAVAIPTGDRMVVPLVHPSRISRAQIDSFIAAIRLLL